MMYAQTFDFISLEFCVTSVSSAYAVYRESLGVRVSSDSNRKGLHASPGPALSCAVQRGWELENT